MKGRSNAEILLLVLASIHVLCVCLDSITRFGENLLHTRQAVNVWIYLNRYYFCCHTAISLVPICATQEIRIIDHDDQSVPVNLLQD